MLVIFRDQRFAGILDLSWIHGTIVAVPEFELEPVFLESASELYFEFGFAKNQI